MEAPVLLLAATGCSYAVQRGWPRTMTSTNISRRGAADGGSGDGGGDGGGGHGLVLLLILAIFAFV